MKAESIVFAVAGMCFGVILGWVIAVQQDRSEAPPAATAAAQPAPAQSTGNSRQAAVLDEARVQALMAILNGDPKNAGAAVQLANEYYGARRYDEAIDWFERALAIEPSNVDASTDLAVSYYYVGQMDRALRQFDTSLRMDPRHTKTLLNHGIVLAFGKQDLAAAAVSWKKVVEIAPDSPEGQAARRALEGVSSAGHPGGAAAPGS